MHVLVLLSAFALVCCSSIAVFTKAGDISAFRASLSSFGFPSWSQSAMTIGILVAEACTVIAILILPLRWGGVIGLLLLTAFTIVSAAALIRGQRPECQCFGNFSTDRIGSRTILRNVALAAFSVVLVTEQQTLLTVIESSNFSTLIMSGMAIVIAGLIAVLYVLLTRYGEVLHTLAALRVEDVTHMPGKGPKPGQPPPVLTLLDEDRHSVELTEALSDSKSTALVFLSTTCDQCDEIIPLLENGANNGISGIAIISGVLALAGHDERFRDLLRTNWSVLFTDADLNRHFHIAGFPALVPLDERGKVKGEALLGRQRIEHFLVNSPRRENSLGEQEIIHDQHVGQNAGTAAHWASAD